MTDETANSSGDAVAEGAETVHCFACSEVNPVSLGMRLWLDDDVCRGTFTPRPEHCGWTGVTHGGLLFTALDEVMANWLWLQQLRGVTARAEVRFREQVATGTPLLLEAHAVERRRRLITLAASAKRASDGIIVAESEAKFMVEG
ncbi:MAG: PaaI family thioesterase [Gammaproteobacteria bacterium]|nr:PaaI family thioesterase [Gammaproteobacteria bacterium]